MNIEKLHEFLVLSQALNYSRAADNLYITQSVLSKHITELEKELGLTLFQRSTHGVQLTTAGQLLAQEAPKLIKSCNLAINHIQLQNMPSKGTLKIGCVLELSYSSHIQIFVSQFSSRYPDIDIVFDVLTSESREDTLSSSYDIIFTPCEYQSIPEYIEATLIQKHTTYALLYPDHPLLSKSLLSIKDLKGETFIVPFADNLLGPYAKNWQLVKKYTNNKVNCIFAPNTPTAVFLVSIGKGIAIVPRYVRSIRPSNLFMVQLSSHECHFNEYIYYNAGQKNSVAELFYNEFCDTYALL